MATNKEVKSNRDVEQEPIPTVEQENQTLREDNQRLRDSIDLFSERLHRLEAVSSSAKLRKYDEQNDPMSLKHTGHVPSEDGIDPILFLKRTGHAQTKLPNGEYEDAQVLHGKTASGKDVSYTFESFISRCSGNSIPAVIENYEEFRANEEILREKIHLFQRSNGKSARTDTVALRKEIRKLEENLMMKVTLSLDLGKSFTGQTVEIHQPSVWNALP